MTEYDGIVIRHYSHQELADLYNVCWRTFQQWLEPHQQAIGKRRGRYYTAKQVRIIFDLIGLPPGDGRRDKAAA